MPSRQSEQQPADALAVLRADHAQMIELFEQFEQMKDDVDEQEKDALVARICGELIVHAAIEEELFYPEAREVVSGHDDIFDEALVEHASAKDLIAQLGEMEPEDDLYDAKVTVLGEYVKHHIDEEQNELFPAVAQTELDLEDLGRRLVERKAELMDEIGLADLDALMPQARGGRPGEARAR